MYRFFKSLRPSACTVLLLIGGASQLEASTGVDDLFIGFNTTGSLNSTKDYLIDIGQASTYASDTTTILNIGNVGTDIASLYGSSWYNNMGVLWGAIAGAVITTGSDAAGTLYASAPTTAVGTAAPAWLNSSSQIPTASAILGMGDQVTLNINSTPGTATGGNINSSYIQAASDANSWKTLGGEVPAFGFFNSTIEAAFTGTNAGSAVLDLFQLPQGGRRTSGQPGNNIGYFSIDNSGNIKYTPYALTTNGGGGNSYAGPWNWTAGSGSWSGTNSWQSNSPATNGQNIGITGAAGGTITNDSVSSLGSLSYSNAAGAYTLTGSNVALTGGITNNSANAQSINVGLTTSTNQTFNAANGNLSIGGAIANSAVLTLAEGATKSIALNGAVTGTGALVQSGPGTLTLAGANSYSGGTSVNAGTVVLGNNASFGTGAVSIASNATITAGVQNLATPNALTLTSGATATLNTGSNTWTQSGAISGSGGMTKTGAGMLTLTASNSYTGATLVSAGTLQVNGSLNSSGSVTLASGTTLSGKGSVGAVMVSKGATLAPGADVGIGNLTLQSSIWSPGGNYNWQIADASGAKGISYDSLTIMGGLNLSTLSSTNRFNINLWSLAGSTSGQALNFNPNVSSSWTLASVLGSITGFSTNDFLINTVATNGTGGFSNLLNGGFFGITTNATGLILSYTTKFISGGNAIWSLASGNLSANQGITNGAGLIFTGAGGSVTNNAVTNLSSMTFSNTAGHYTVGGNGVTLGAGGIINNSTNEQTITSGLNLGTNETFTAASGNLNFNGSITNNGHTLTLNGASNIVLGGILSGTGGLTESGTGTLTITGAQIYTGLTTVASGTLLLSGGNNRLLSTGSVAVSSGAKLDLGSNSQQLASLTGTGTVTGTGGILTLAPTNSTAFGGSLTGSEQLALSGTGTMTLSGSNSYTGGTAINAGTLITANALALGAGTNAVSVGNSGTLNLAGQTITQGSLLLSNGIVTNGTLAANNVTLQGGTVAASLSGAALLTQASGTTTLSGSNSYTGGTKITGGSLITANNFALGSTNASALLAGGTLNLGGNSIKLGSVTLTSGSLGGGTLTASHGVAVNGGGTISATLAGTGGLTKTGSGILNLATALPGGSVAVTGGTLLSSSSVIGATTNTPSGVTIKAANWTNSGILTIGGSGNGTLAIGSGGGVAASGLIIAANAGSKGTVTLGDSNGAASLSLGSGSLSFGSGNGNLIFNQNGAVQITNSISGKGTITSSGTGTTTLSGNDSGFAGTNYLSSGTVAVGANSRLGGAVNIAGKSAMLALNTGASLTGTNVHAVAGTLLDHSGLAFTSSIKGSVVLATTGDLQKTYAAGASVAGFGAGIGAGKSFSILAGTVAAATTLDAHLVNGVLDFKGTFGNAIALGLTDPSFSAIKNTILWYNTNTSTWQNTITGNTGNVIKSGYQGFSGTFSSFLLTDGINLNLGLSQIMGAYGYDAATHSAWAVIDHNSLFASDDAAVTSFGNGSVSDAPVTTDLSVFQSGTENTIQAVPEPGSLGLVALGGLLLLFLTSVKISRKLVRQ